MNQFAHSGAIDGHAVLALDLEALTEGANGGIERGIDIIALEPGGKRL